MQAERFNPVPPSSSGEFCADADDRLFLISLGSQSISLQWVFGGGRPVDLRQHQRVLLVTGMCVTRWSHSPHESVGEVLHEGVNLAPVSGHASRPVTGEQQWLVSRSRISTGGGGGHTVRGWCPVPQPQLDGGASHVLDTRADECELMGMEE